MKTFKINKSEITTEQLQLITEGYKVVKYDLSTNGDSSFKYGDKNEDIIDTIWKADGDLSACHWGLHFSKDPANVFNFYEPLGYNRYFKVKSYGQILEHKNNKSITSILEFVEEYNLMEFINIIKNYNRVENAVNYSNAVNGSIAVNDSNAVNGSIAVNDSNAVNYSNAVRSSNAVNDSIAVNGSIAVNDSIAVNGSIAILNCECVKNSIFCYKVECCKNMVFNKQVTEERFFQVYNKLKSFNWLPKFTNAYEIKGNKEWWAFCFPELVNNNNKEAWSSMPKKMEDYIKGLDEYDEKVFKNITE